jgi:leucyl/phenylalanyl-tRNA---protein transferase
MPIFALRKDIVFPPVELADKSGILAVGGDLTPERLIEAYGNGIFPWYSEGDPIIWWSPDPRFVLYPDEIKISKSMRQVLRRGLFTITFDRSFREVIDACRGPRRDDAGTWITDDMFEAYIELHRLGYAHSVEAWYEGSLAGGLYGVSLGTCFFGESMFTKMSNASKAALITLTVILGGHGFHLVDCQVYTEHLKSLGARHIPRNEFINSVKKGLLAETILGSWEHLIDRGIGTAADEN